MIQVRHLARSFGSVAAVRNVTFDAPDGAITGLLGRNGAGKTTTLKLLAGLLRPSRGTVRIDGLELADGRRQVQQRVGALLDHHGLYARLTAREHLIYFGRLRGVAPAALPARVDALLGLLGLEATADRRVAGFSQGERIKVALGCAMVHQPGHVLLDEATNGLDVPSARNLRQLLKRLRDDGACIVFSSHVLGDVQDVCDRLVIVAEGTVVAQGTPDEVRQRAGRAALDDAFVALTSAITWEPARGGRAAAAHGRRLRADGGSLAVTGSRLDRRPPRSSRSRSGAAGPSSTACGSGWRSTRRNWRRRWRCTATSRRQAGPCCSRAGR